jgi:arylsulfatase
LTGVYAQQNGNSENFGKLENAVTLGEVLRDAGYRTLASGKHHGTENLYDRGFDHYYGLRDGCCNFWNPGVQRPGEADPGRKRARYWCIDEKTYYPYTPEDPNFYATDAFTDYALSWLDEPETKNKPFFLYLSYNAPHYPLHAWPEDIAKYKGVFDGGYHAIQKNRYKKQVKMGLIDPEVTPLTQEPKPGAWESLSSSEKAREAKRMEIYAAMLDRVDQNVGRVVNKLKAQGKLENTLIMFASDNGGCAEDTGAVVFSEDPKDAGKVASFDTVGESWAIVQNTPFRFYKNYSHEGGICTPFIASWPKGIKKTGGLNDQVAHFIDIMPTVAEIGGAVYPKNHHGTKITPMQGISLLPAFKGNSLKREKPVFWSWKKGSAIRDGNMKAVRWGDEWELYDLSVDRNETVNLANTNPETLQNLVKQWERWFADVSP